MPLTAKKIKELTPRPLRYMVTDSAGLCLEVSPKGRMSWRFRYRLHGKPGKINLGYFPEMSLAEARSKRDEMAAAIRSGDAPQERKRRERAAALRSITVREFADRYFREVVLKARKSPARIRRYLDREILPAIGAMPLAKVDQQDMQAIFFRKRDAGFAQTALALRDLLKRMWDYANVCGAATANPAHLTPAKFIATRNQRTRTLSEREIGIFARALDLAKIAPRYRIALEIILLTLVRKSELRLARWEHIDLRKAEWLIPEENSKNGRELLIPLSRQVAKLFQDLNPSESGEGLILPMAASSDQPISETKLNRELWRVPMRLAHFTIHDLRRTGSTRLNEMGFDSSHIEKALNHSEKGVRGIYNRAEYFEPRRVMLQAWADHVDKLKGEK